MAWSIVNYSQGNASITVRLRCSMRYTRACVTNSLHIYYLKNLIHNRTVKVSIAAASSYIKITLFYKKVTLQVHLPTFIGAGKLYFTNLRSI